MPFDSIVLDVDVLAISPVNTVIGEAKAFANKINWNPNNDLVFDSNAKIIDISKSVFGRTNFGDDTIIASNILLSNNYFFDYDIEMKKDYRYTLKIDDKTLDSDGNPTPPYKKYIYMTGLSETVKNCIVNYNNSTNSITINWDNIKSFNNTLNETSISYNIWIFDYNSKSNLIKFNSTTNSITITSGDTGYDVKDEATVNFTIQQAHYFIYVTPYFETTITEDIGPTMWNKDSYSSFFFTGRISIPNTRLKITTEKPKNFKISSQYNGKISFSWSKPELTTDLVPSKYRLSIEDPSIESDLPESITNIDINADKTSYTIDNTDLSSPSALKPSSYNVRLCAVYNSLESDNTETLNFTVPVTKVNFDYALVNSNGIRTTNIKNGVACVKLKWDTFSYAEFYRINIQQFDENGNSQDTLVYHEKHPTSEIKLKWNFPGENSRFLIDISYTTDENFTYTPNNTALGQSYLGVDGMTYDKYFTVNTDRVSFNLSRSFVRTI